MAVAVIKYSTPIYDKGELLDGTLYNKIMGWRCTAVIIQTHVTALMLPSMVNSYIPAGYFLTALPQVSPEPPKVKMYSIVATAEKFSATAAAFSIERPTGDIAFKG